MAQASRVLGAILLFLLCCSSQSARLKTSQSQLKTPTSRFIGRLIRRGVNAIKDFKYKRLVPELYGPQPKAPSRNKVLVIGSGFGGAISALRLAQAGVQVSVLERGQSWPIDPQRKIHTFEPTRDGRGLWHRKRARTPISAANAPKLPVDFFGGVLDITEYPNIEVWRGACVGGGSVVYTGASPQPRREYFEEIFGNQVDWQEMNDTYYPRVRDMLRLTPIPEDIYRSKPFGKSRVWDQQARNAGYTIERPPSVFNWDIIRDELAGRVRKSAIIGMSNMGNSNGAKFDVRQNYLKDAQETGFAKVYANHRVTDIEQRDDGLFVVRVEHLSPRGRVVDRSTHTAQSVVLAAGSIGSTELAVKAKEKGTILGLRNNDAVGKGWGSNGDAYVARSFNKIRGLTQASPCTSLIHDTDGPAPTTLEAWYVPGVPIDVGIQGTLGIVYDRENRGYFRYDHGSDKVSLVWGRRQSDLARRSCERVNAIMANAKPVSIPGVPLLAPSAWTGSTAHPLGGMNLGAATDAYGRVRGVPGLYVMDGAVIPGSTGAVNPSLTISAIVERNIEQVVAQDFAPVRR